MKHKVWLDETTGVIWIRFAGQCNGVDFKPLCEQLHALLEKHPSSKAAIELSEIESFPDEEIRDRLIEEIHSAGFLKVAVIGARPEVKTIGIVLHELLAEYVEARFFLRQQDAASWLAGD